VQKNLPNFELVCYALWLQVVRDVNSQTRLDNDQGGKTQKGCANKARSRAVTGRTKGWTGQQDKQNKSILLEIDTKL
jgi:hypothetical protein